MNEEKDQLSIARIDFLDGIRGWASFAVLLSHVLMCFLVLTTPFLQYDNARLVKDLSNGNYFDILPWIALNFITDGNLAVIIFFILSGYALSVGQLDLENRKLALAATSRYFRLMIPILITSLIAYLLLKFNLMFNLEVATTPEKSSGWLGTFYKFDANIKDVIKFSFYDVFFRYDINKTYNSSLWTMPIEIAGSFLIYAYLGIFRATEKVRWRLVIISTAMLFIIEPLYACFLIGYVIAEINNNIINYQYRFLESKKSEIFFIGIFFTSAILSTFFRDNNYQSCIFASFLVLSVSFSKGLKSFFSSSISKFLGNISFPLYLIQIPIICSWSSFLYLMLPRWGFDVTTSNMINLFLTVIVSLLSATLLLPIEKLAIIFSKKIGRFLLS